ncbi:YrbL family protein [Rhodovulum steppense]|uniref:PhoP regulatory network protein YrbL n=1 Tax=Rhodovulum steppense TaxID=540251 RepID=A0A4R1YTK9_9RHOB|nr:YrbL family protein [Rhodovulum steppense]TCM84392.1 PhoP regulatory network protein YrbL [Rhodovulum steppense]
MFDRWNFGHLSQRLFPAARYRSTAKQYDEYRRLIMERLFDTGFDLPISHLYGFVKTNLGFGCVTERITDAQGNTAQNLRERVLARSFTADDLEGLNRFIARLYEVSICAADMGPANFVHGHRHIGPENARTAPGWVLVDGFGDRFAITIRSVSRPARTRGMDRRFIRGKKVKGLVWQPDQRRFAFAEDYTPIR